MKSFIALCAVAVLGFMNGPAMAEPEVFQMTGPVASVSDSKIAIQKGNDKWEIPLGSTKVPPGVKVGSKITIEYTMEVKTILAIAKPGRVSGSGDTDKAPAVAPAATPAAAPAVAPAAAPAKK